MGKSRRKEIEKPIVRKQFGGADRHRAMEADENLGFETGEAGLSNLGRRDARIFGKSRIGARIKINHKQKGEGS